MNHPTLVFRFGSNAGCELGGLPNRPFLAPASEKLGATSRVVWESRRWFLIGWVKGCSPTKLCWWILFRCFFTNFERESS